MKVLIVGGVAGGASAATRLRRLDEQAEIILFEKGPFISYANCGLPYYIGRTIRDQEQLVVTKPELLRARFAIDVRTKSEVVGIDRSRKVVTVRDLEAGHTYEEGYDKLLLSPGAEPKHPRLDGVDAPEIYTLRTVPDTLAIDRYIGEQSPQRAVVVGGGFIGVEMAENLRERGIEVTVVEFLKQVVAPLDPEMAAILHGHLTENGVNLRLGVGVERFERRGDVLHVCLSDGSALPADLVLLSIGVAPESKLAKDAGLMLGLGGSIQVDDTLATSDQDIYAVGDAVSVRHIVSGQETLLPLAGPASKQGRIAAENMLGGTPVRFKGVQGSAVLKVFDLAAAATGLNEKQLKQLGLPYHKTYIHPSSHASYYPGAAPLSMKLLFAPDGKLLGAQAVGSEGADKRIDVLAAAIRLGGTVYDLEELELGYAPPFSSAKDPVNMLGFTAANILRGDMPVVYAEDVDALDRKAVTLLDIRTAEERMIGELPGSVHIPLDQLRGRLAEVPQEKPVYVYCSVGQRGYVAQRILLQRGYEAYNLSGGYKTYRMVHEEPVQEQPCAKTDCIGVPKPAVSQEIKVAIEVDACGLQCPGPIMKVSEAMAKLKTGDCLCVRATDPAFVSDAGAWCERTGNRVVGKQRDKGVYTVMMQKGDNCAVPQNSGGNDKTMVVFSGDLDKAIATFIIANGAAAMGRKVTLFFTFWGLNILRRGEKIHTEKNLIEKMFGKMMPRGSRKLGLSRMNMGGMGAKMIRSVMRKKNVQSLEELMQQAIQSGVRVIACQMSMDVMGIRQEELIDGVEVGGVATFLGAAEQSDTNLFI